MYLVEPLSHVVLLQELLQVYGRRVSRQEQYAGK